MLTSARLELATLSVLTIRDNQLHQPANQCTVGHIQIYEQND